MRGEYIEAETKLPSYVYDDWKINLAEWELMFVPWSQFDYKSALFM